MKHIFSAPSYEQAVKMSQDAGIAGEDATHISIYGENYTAAGIREKLLTAHVDDESCLHGNFTTAERIHLLRKVNL